VKMDGWIFCLFDDAFQLHSLYKLASNIRIIVNDKLERMYKESIMCYSVYYPGIHQERLRKATDILLG
jgi:hypothetical protein